MAASSVLVEQESYIDFAQFDFDDFNGYYRIFTLWDNIRKGRIIKQDLIYYNVCPYTIIRIRENLEFRDYFLREVQNILKKYEEQFPGDKNLLHVAREFQDQAWTFKLPSLFSMMLSGEIPINFNDPKIVVLLQEYYKFPQTGKYADLIAEYKESILDKFGRKIPTNLGMANRDFFDIHINEVFAWWNNVADEDDDEQIIEPDDLFAVLLSKGAYEIFLMIMHEAAQRKDAKALRAGSRMAIFYRNLDLAKSVFDPNTGIYSMVDPELRQLFHVNYYSSSKEIYDYCSKLWKYEPAQAQNRSNIFTSVIYGDYDMFKLNLRKAFNPKYSKLTEDAADGGSVKIFRAIEKVVIHRELPYKTDIVVSYVISSNCIDLARWLINKSPKKDVYLKSFIRRFETRKSIPLIEKRELMMSDPFIGRRDLMMEVLRIELTKDRPEISDYVDY